MGVQSEAEVSITVSRFGLPGVEITAVMGKSLSLTSQCLFGTAQWPSESFQIGHKIASRKQQRRKHY
jgi:hypothetical protein